MSYFNFEELSTYDNIISNGIRYKKDSINIDTNKIKSIRNKINKLGDNIKIELDKHNFFIDKNSWQNSGYFNKYLWVKLSCHGSKDLFFTFEIDGQNKEFVCKIDYKHDCALANKLFIILTHFEYNDNFHIKIKYEKLIDMSFYELTYICKKFIEENISLYDEILFALKSNYLFDQDISGLNLCDTKKETTSKSEKFKYFNDYSFINFELKNARYAQIGNIGEVLVLEYEKTFLASINKNLVNSVRKVADNSGFDILSFDVNGNEKYIEVKSTIGALETEFFLSNNEYEFLNSNSKKYYLYRVYYLNINKMSGSLMIYHNDFNKFEFKPNQYKVQIK